MLTTHATRTAELIEPAPGLWGAVQRRPLRRIALAPEPQQDNRMDRVWPDLARLWREIQDLPAHEVDLGLSHLLERLSHLLAADTMHWHLQGTLRSGKTVQMASQDWCARLSLEAAGHSRGPELEQTMTLPNGLRMHFCARRHPGAEAFDTQQRLLLEMALTGLSRWLNWLALSHGPLTPAGALPPHQRKVLLLLVTGRSEKQIASELCLSTNTTHQYVTTLYRRFGVRNRPSLAAQWLGGI